MKINQIPVYLINLKRDAKRRRQSAKQLMQAGINPIITEAFDCHNKYFPFYEYRNLSRGKWWDYYKFKPGAFGCYLSHAKCWQQISVGDAPYGLILEDDILINEQSFENFELNNEIESLDVVFINAGVTRLLNLASSSIPDDTEFVSVDKLIKDLLINERFNDELTPGGYGYLLSKKGAKKLLQIMRREKACMGVDYAILFSSLSDETLRLTKNLSYVPKYLQIYIENLEEKNFYDDMHRILLNSYVTTLPAIVSHDDTGKSSLNHEILLDFDLFNKRNSIPRRIMRYLNQYLPRDK